jgi:phosphatidylglycerol:prolipoprotein diacylglycerol transferase
MAIEIPPIDPVALQLGPVMIRWYALAYLAGFLLGWKYCLHLISRKSEGYRPNTQDIDDFLVWTVIGVILGGRIGYVLFYQFAMYVQNPLEIFQIWHGGMSFHGGALGVIAALMLFTWRRKISLLKLSDVVCAAVPIGLFFGRIANFINGELMGRPTTVAWGVIFPDGYNVIRHPSQIYEALLEGLVLFVILHLLMKKELRPGIVTGVFLMGYAVFRALVEFVRQPDSQIGLIGDAVTMGQILCLPMFILGLGVCVYASRAKSDESAAKAE